MGRLIKAGKIFGIVIAIWLFSLTIESFYCNNLVTARPDSDIVKDNAFCFVNAYVVILPILPFAYGLEAIEWVFDTNITF